MRTPPRYMPPPPARDPPPAEREYPRSPSAAAFGDFPPARPGPPPRAPDPRPDGAVALDIDWLGAMRDAALAPNRRRLDEARPFLSANRAALDSLSLPVLLPGDPTVLAGARLFAHGDYYTLSYAEPGLSIVLTGYARAFPLSDGAAATLPRGGLRALMPADGLVVASTEVGRDVDFQRYGAAYGLSLECDDFEADPRCTSDAYIRSLVAQIALAIPGQGG